MNSALGKYAQVVAAISAVGIIAAYVATGILGNVEGQDSLHDAFLIAIGAVFTSAAVVNGYKQQQVALQKRLDAAGIPTANVDPLTDPDL